MWIRLETELEPSKNVNFCPLLTSGIVNSRLCFCEGMANCAEL